MISQDFLIITKLEAAERQSDEAIRLFFQRRDSVSIHTLAAAAYQVVTDACKRRGVPRELEDSDLLEKMGVKRDVLKAIREPQNFFKHAEREDEDSVRFNPMLSAVLIMACVQYLLQLGIEQSAEREVFRTWFFLFRPQDVPAPFKSVATNARQFVDPEDYEFFLAAIDKQRKAKAGEA